MLSKIIDTKKTDVCRYVLGKKDNKYIILKSARTYFGWSPFEYFLEFDNLADAKSEFYKL